MRGFNHKKAVQALNFLAIKEGGSINKMKAIKLIWLSDRLHLRKHGRTITGDYYFALPHGPVPSATRDLLESNSFSLGDEELEYSSNYLNPLDKLNFQSKKNADNNVFSETDIIALTEVYNKYGNYTQFSLRDLSHEFPEWKKYQSALESKIASRFPIEIIDFFEDAPKGFDYFAIDDAIKEMSKEIFLESDTIAKFLR